MHTAVIINLNYENQQGTQCKVLWNAIETGMRGCGFTKTGRGFVTDLDVDMASALAQDVLNKIDADYVAAGQALRPLIREFYCMPDTNIVDLWRPSVHSIEVRQMEAGAFERFFGATAPSTLTH